MSANGSFTFPGTATSGQGYEVNVKAQPTNPDQIRTVEHGTGQVSSANVTDIAVHCATQVIPSGLDSTFGDHGRVTTPGTGEGRAVLIQPDGGIVTVGSREVGARRRVRGGRPSRSRWAGEHGLRRRALHPRRPPGPRLQYHRGRDDRHHGPRRRRSPSPSTPTARSLPPGSRRPVPSTSTSRSCATTPTARSIRASTATGSSPPTSAPTTTSPTPSPCSPTERSSSSAAPTRTSRSLATSPTGNSTPPSRHSDRGQQHRRQYRQRRRAHPGGTILIAGTRGGAAIVASYAPNGRINLGFGNFGVTQADISNGPDSRDDLTLDNAGDIVLVGSASSATVSDMALVRFKLDGTLDTTLTADFNGTGDFGHALAIDAQGRIVAAGTSGDQFALMRAFL